MLHEQLKEYLSEIENAVVLLEDIYIERYEEELISKDRVNLRIRVRFSRGQLLEINEAVIIENNRIQHLNYRYHFQDDRNTVLFRYDNTPHFPKIETFPHHKHLSDRVVKSDHPSILKVIEEVQRIVG